MIGGIVSDVTPGHLFGIAAVLVALGVPLAIWRGVGSIRAEVGSMKAEFRNNGGSTMRDVVDEIRKEQVSIKALVRGHGEELSRLADAGRAIAERVTNLEGEAA